MDDNDLSDPPTIAQALGHNATKKVAGARRKGKQKARKPKVHNAVDLDDQVVAKRGRPSGAGNYSENDITALLDITAEELPLGQRGWTTIHLQYAKWAHKNGRPERTVKSLETKFKQVCRSV